MIQEAHIPECPRTLDGSSPYLTMYRTQPIVFISCSVKPIWLQPAERVVRAAPVLRGLVLLDRAIVVDWSRLLWRPAGVSP